MSEYDKIAGEYYDAQRHKTCRNFDYTTLTALNAERLFLPMPIIEVGAGRGRCLEFTKKAATVQVDSSMEMLNLWPREPAVRVHASATEMPFPNKSFNTLVAFLCDPFLDAEFLKEARRVVADTMLLTTPAYEWGTALRGGEKHETTFAKADGTSVTVPSKLHTVERIKELVTTAGFSSVHVSKHCLPKGMPPSSAITDAAANAGVDPYELPIIYVIRAK